MTATATARPMASERNISFIGRPGRGSAPYTPRGGLPASLQGLLDLPGGPAQVLALDVGGDAQVALHRRCGRYSPGMVPLPTRATSRTIRLMPGSTSAQRHRLHLGRRIHALRRHLDLHLVADARLRILPEVAGDHAAGRGGHQHRVARPASTSTPLRPAFCAVDVDRNGRIIQRLLDLHVAQPGDLAAVPPAPLRHGPCAAEDWGWPRPPRSGVGEPKLMTSLTMSPGSKAERDLPGRAGGLVARQPLRAAAGP